MTTQLMTENNSYHEKKRTAHFRTDFQTVRAHFGGGSEGVQERIGVGRDEKGGSVSFR